MYVLLKTYRELIEINTKGSYRKTPDWIFPPINIIYFMIKFILITKNLNCHPFPTKYLLT